ncbi:response regulator transcription factor [Bacillus sp. OK048]|uniref:response regulator n=1 Tax=Bacillus sp. OK048 TaxID=1882761 RepID=UPI0008894CFB|nr:response regulator transcription factor [Bacillus sp. OK048]SDN33834.1 two-component system, NarL family, response regulator DesR [Bacillus sp. OK048]
MIRIVIAEHQKLLLEAMGNLLNLEDDIIVVGQADNGEEALNMVHRYQPDVCIIDLEMPGKSGLEAVEAIQLTDCKVIILTTFARPGYYQRAWDADVKGYLLKDNPSEVLADSIRSIMHGNRIFSNELLDDHCESTDEQSLPEPSSQLEQNKTGIVKSYFSSIIDKMKLPTG